MNDLKKILQFIADGNGTIIASGQAKGLLDDIKHLEQALKNSKGLVEAHKKMVDAARKGRNDTYVKLSHEMDKKQNLEQENKEVKNALQNSNEANPENTQNSFMNPAGVFFKEASSKSVDQFPLELWSSRCAEVVEFILFNGQYAEIDVEDSQKISIDFHNEVIAIEMLEQLAHIKEHFVQLDRHSDLTIEMPEEEEE